MKALVAIALLPTLTIAATNSSLCSIWASAVTNRARPVAVSGTNAPALPSSQERGTNVDQRSVVLRRSEMGIPPTGPQARHDYDMQVLSKRAGERSAMLGQDIDLLEHELRHEAVQHATNLDVRVTIEDKPSTSQPSDGTADR